MLTNTLTTPPAPNTMATDNEDKPIVKKKKVIRRLVGRRLKKPSTVPDSPKIPSCDELPTELVKSQDDDTSVDEMKTAPNESPKIVEMSEIPAGAPTNDALKETSVKTTASERSNDVVYCSQSAKSGDCQMRPTSKLKSPKIKVLLKNNSILTRDRLANRRPSACSSEARNLSSGCSRSEIGKAKADAVQSDPNVSQTRTKPTSSGLKKPRFRSVKAKASALAVKQATSQLKPELTDEKISVNPVVVLDRINVAKEKKQCIKENATGKGQVVSDAQIKAKKDDGDGKRASSPMTSLSSCSSSVRLAAKSAKRSKPTISGPGISEPSKGSRRKEEMVPTKRQKAAQLSSARSAIYRASIAAELQRLRRIAEMQDMAANLWPTTHLYSDEEQGERASYSDGEPATTELYSDEERAKEAYSGGRKENWPHSENGLIEQGIRQERNAESIEMKPRVKPLVFYSDQEDDSNSNDGNDHEVGDDDNDYDDDDDVDDDDDEDDEDDEDDDDCEDDGSVGWQNEKIRDGGFGVDKMISADDVGDVSSVDDRRCCGKNDERLYVQTKGRGNSGDEGDKMEKYQFSDIEWESSDGEHKVAADDHNLDEEDDKHAADGDDDDDADDDDEHRSLLHHKGVQLGEGRSANVGGQEMSEGEEEVYGHNDEAGDADDAANDVDVRQVNGDKGDEMVADECDAIDDEQEEAEEVEDVEEDEKGMNGDIKDTDDTGDGDDDDDGDGADDDSSRKLEHKEMAADDCEAAEYEGHGSKKGHDDCVVANHNDDNDDDDDNDNADDDDDDDDDEILVKKNVLHTDQKTRNNTETEHEILDQGDSKVSEDDATGEGTLHAQQSDLTKETDPSESDNAASKVKGREEETSENSVPEVEISAAENDRQKDSASGEQVEANGCENDSSKGDNGVDPPKEDGAFDKVDSEVKKQRKEPKEQGGVKRKGKKRRHHHKDKSDASQKKRRQESTSGRQGKGQMLEGGKSETAQDEEMNSNSNSTSGTVDEDSVSKQTLLKGSKSKTASLVVKLPSMKRKRLRRK